jgi:hypothetical protein
MVGRTLYPMFRKKQTARIEFEKFSKGEPLTTRKTDKVW